MSAIAAPEIHVDEQLLLQFVIWNLRVRDLPSAVHQAAARVAAARRHPRPAGGEIYVDAPFRVSAIPQTEQEPIIDASGDRASVPGLVSEQLLELRPKYVLVTDLSERT